MKQNKMAIVAAACGVVCAVCVMIFMMNVRGEADAARTEALARFGGEQVEAYVATRDIVAGERVDLSAIETKLWVADLLPENAVRSSSDVVGKTATSSIFKGEVFISGRFEYDRDAIDVPQGKQAVSVPAKAVQAVGGAIRPGMSVDVYSSGDSTTAALAQNVTVLDTSMGNSGALTLGGNGWITLAVDPDRVQEIIAASNKTSLYFTLPGEQMGEAGERSATQDAAEWLEQETSEQAAQDAQGAQAAQDAQEASEQPVQETDGQSDQETVGQPAQEEGDSSAQEEPEQPAQEEPEQSGRKKDDPSAQEANSQSARSEPTVPAEDSDSSDDGLSEEEAEGEGER